MDGGMVNVARRLSFETYTSRREVHPLRKSSPGISSSDTGDTSRKSSDCREEQLTRTAGPMEMMRGGRVRCWREVQPLRNPIRRAASSTMEDIFTSLRDVQPIKKNMSICSTLFNSAKLTPSSFNPTPVSYTHLRAHETPEHLVCRLLLEKKKKIYESTQQ
eukprot:TRINITY_DN20529_c0_g1_i2.p1 TRINITY_DN20529_c0_g1~~TRINITY_DN20529_c0_g1_i2.p1  ORF type:complete len:161 (-),score=33.13 TRINITY_DN20529_c0_g1_i2:30-512(-)